MGRSAYIGRKREIPEKTEYTPVEYLRFTGEQYIITDFVPNQDTRMVIDCQLGEVSGNNFSGSRSSTSKQAFTISTVSSKWRIGYNTSSPMIDILADTERHIFDLNKNVLSMDGEVIYTATYAEFDGYGPIYLGAILGSSQVYAAQEIAFYSVQIYDNGVLVRDYIPALDNNCVPCFYDKVEGKYYYNAGGGVIGAGPMLLNYSELPEGYTLLSHVESTGEQYFDTGFKPNNNTRVVMDVQLSQKNASSAAFFGAREGATQKNYAVMYSSGSLRSDYNNAYTQTFSADLTKRFIVDKNKESTSVEGEVQSYKNTSFQTPVNMFLLANNDGGAVKFCISAKLYFCKIYDNGVLIRDYIPCMYGGVAGLYDLVNDVFYAPVTGEMIAGTRYEKSIARRWTDIFVPVENVARRGRKGWVGVNGVARPFMGDYDLAYYGAVEPMSVARLASESIHLQTWQCVLVAWNPMTDIRSML